MFTKTRKWFFVFVIAFVALFLAACGGDKPIEEEPVKPEDLTIEVMTFVGENGIIVGGDKMELRVSSTTEKADVRVNWHSDTTEVATVDAEGNVTGIAHGRAVITATSKLDLNVKAQVVVLVYENDAELNTGKMKMLLDALAEAKAAMPEYITKTIKLPVVNNHLVKITYTNNLGIVHQNDFYSYEHNEDHYDTIYAELEYLGEKVKFNHQVRVVENVEDNSFTAIDLATKAVDEYIKSISTNGVTLIDLAADEKLDLPLSLSDLDEDYTGTPVSISWTSTNSLVIKNDGTFIRPNDTTNLTLEAYFVAGPISAVNRHAVVADGYEEAEIIAEILSVVPREVTAQNLPLTSYNGKFGATVKWATEKAESLSADGKVNPFLTEKETVKLTATIKYFGTLSEDFAFETEVEVPITLNPAANEAQGIVHALSNAFETALVSHLPYGVKDRVGGNKLSLPATVGEVLPDNANATAAIKWTVSEEGIFDEEWNLLKQYLRYHAVPLTYSVTIGADTITGIFVVNTGIAELENTIYAGGNMYSRSANQPQPFDELHQFKGADGQNGTIGTSTDVKGWTGTTFYTDQVHAVSGVVTRYQYFVSNLYSVVFKPGVTYGVDANGVINKGATSPNGTSVGNRQTTFVNLTDSTIKIPVAITDVGARLSTNPEAVLTNWPVANTAVAADGTAWSDAGLVYKLYRTGFITNSEGLVIEGATVNFKNAAGTEVLTNRSLQEIWYEEWLADKDNVTLKNYIELEPGAIAYNKGDVGPVALGPIFAKPGITVKAEHYTVWTAPVVPEA